MTFELKEWKRLWLVRGIEVRTVPQSSMIEVNGVRGFLVPEEIELFLELGASLPKDAQYLEIGSYLGLSSILVAYGFLSNLNFGARAHCVDTWEGSPEHRGMIEVRTGTLFESFRRNVEASKVGALI
jgi:hypothetical protein